MAVAVAIVVVSWLLVSRSPLTSQEERWFRLVNGSPAGLWPLVWGPMQLGNLAGPALVAATAAMSLRRVRPPAAVVLAGYGAWGAAQVVKHNVARSRPEGLLSDVILREGAHGLGFVSGHAAVAAAIATAVWPYLTRRGRVATVLLVALVGLGRVYSGAHLPLDVVGGIAIGVLSGLAANAVVGLPSQPVPHHLRDVPLHSHEDQGPS